MKRALAVLALLTFTATGCEDVTTSPAAQSAPPRAVTTTTVATPPVATRAPAKSPTPKPVAVAPKPSPTKAAVVPLPRTPAPVRTTTKPKTVVASTCGAPANPWGYNFCGRGSFIGSPPADFCDYFDCIASFWENTRGYVMQCEDHTYSHSGGRSGSCSHHGGNYRALTG